MKRPAFQFYPADWRRDAALQSCSIAARGMWIELMCVMHDCEPYGVLSINGKPMTASQVARLVGESEKLVDKLIGELEAAGVCSRDAEGRLFSRRMVKDEGVREARAAGGAAGAEHGIKGASHGSKGGRPRKNKDGLKGDEKTPLKTTLQVSEKPPPSSSSSSSPSGYSDPDGSDAAGVKPDKPAMEPDEIIFGYGVPLLVNAGSTDKAARSFLGGLRKQHGDTTVIDKLRECFRAKPLQPLEWLAAALPPGGAKPAENKQEAIEARNRGVADEWASTPAGAAT